MTLFEAGAFETAHYILYEASLRLPKDQYVARLRILIHAYRHLAKTEERPNG